MEREDQGGSIVYRMTKEEYQQLQQHEDILDGISNNSRYNWVTMSENVSRYLGEITIFIYKDDAFLIELIDNVF